jgi:hypothetical protein
MGFLKKITRPISRALDKIIPNEVKPALPFLAAAAPFMAPGLMGLGGNTMLSRALMSGGLNLGSQLAQEGSDGDFSALSLAMASGIGALSAPNAASTIRGVDPNFVGPRPAAEGILGQGKEYLARGAEFLGPQTGGVTDILGKGGTQAGLNMETLKAASIPFTQGTTDLAVAENRRAMRDYEREQAEYEAGMNKENSNRAFAIRQSMEAYGFTEQEILDAIEAAGYRAGGRVGLEFGGIPAAVESVEEKPKEFLVDKLKVTVQPGQSEQMAIMNAMMNDIDEVMPEDRKMEFYKLYLPQLRASGEISENEYEGLMGELFGEGKAEGGLMNLGGREMDMRTGGFIPIGKKERADDVPARLSKNEFVMTADAVRAAGGGSVNEGARRMYNLMNNLEAKV